MEDEKKTKKQLIEELNCLRLEQSEQTRITSEKFTKAFLQNSIPTIITSVKDGSVVEASDAFLRLVGLKRHEIIGHTSTEAGFITEEQRATFFNELKKSGRIENLEMEIRPSDGALKDGLFNSIMISLNNENCLLTTIQDITERKKAESELRENEEKYRLLFNGIGDAIFIHDKEERILAVNWQACEKFGYTHAELMSMRISQVDSPADVQHIPQRIDRVIEQGSLVFEISHRRKDGSLIQNEVSSQHVIWDNKPAIMSICRDLTDRRQAEKELRDSEERFRVLFNSGKDYFAVHLTGKDGMPTNFVQINDAACNLLGYTREEMLRLKPQDIDSASSSGLVPALIEKFIKDKYILFETEMIAKNGQRIPMEVSLTLFQLQDREATFCVARDITERKLAENALFKSEEKYRSLVTSSLDVIITEDVDGIITFANPVAQNIAGGMDLNGMSVRDFLPLELISKYDEMMENRRQGNSENLSYEWSMISPNDGSILVFDVRSSIVRDKSNSSEILVVARDITKRKQVEEALLKSEEKYRKIAENIVDLIFLVDANGVFQYSTNHKKILGYELEDLIGIKGMSITHPDELERIQKIYEGGVDGVWREITYETRLRHKNGHYVPMEIKGRTFNDHLGKMSGCVFVGRKIVKSQQKKQKTPHAQKSLFAIPELTTREKEIMQWVMQGKSTWDIAQIINISETTVKYHIDKLMKKLSAVNRTHAVAIAMQNKLIK